MLVLSGTIPITGLPLTEGTAVFKDGILTIGETPFPVIQGVATMIAAASESCKALGLNRPYAVVAGDIGKGDGSGTVYEYLKNNLFDLFPKIVVIHYIKPNIDNIKNVVARINTQSDKPVLIADAGAMYVAKAAGIARNFDFFTPDLGEMAFLADPHALHPAYVRNTFFEVDASEVPKLIKQAHLHGNSSKHLLVKGAIDYITENGEIMATVTSPNIPEMEAIGGTGDTLTGILSSLVYAKYDLVQAGLFAARTNRIAGELQQPTVATQIVELIPFIAQALQMLKN